MTYPDGENLYYAYDNGGLLKSAWGMKKGNRYNYVNALTYDEFGQRRHVDYGNGVNSEYGYDEYTRRLETLTTATPDGRTIQNVSYSYDLVGNFLRVQNAIGTTTSTALPAGPVTQVFEYDDLYQLKIANGEYAFGPGKQNLYSNEFLYDTIGNFTRKSQVNRILQPSDAANLPKETNYLLDYRYGGIHPHAVTDAGDKLYSYDAAGNMTGWTGKTNGKQRSIIWNEENRVKEIADNGKSTYFLYDDAGERVLKRGRHGETFYINRFYSIKNGELGTKSIYAGNTRVASKLVKTPNTVTANTATSIPGIQGLDHGLGNKTGIINRLPDGTSTGVLPPEEKDQYFYHGDHLGSSNMITDASGSVYQHLEYFPFGETWIDEGKTPTNIPGYQFTGKELDPETGLYYFGARYYEPVISRWISADPILEKYLPTGDKEKDTDLPGIGGIYNTFNLSVHSYAHQNPLRYKDPDGRETVGQFIDRQAMGAAIAGNDAKTYTYALLGTAWSVFGAESLSKVYDHALGAQNNVSGSDYARAAVDLGAVAGIIKAGNIITKAGSKIIGNAQATGTIGHKAVSNSLAWIHALNPRVTKVSLNTGYRKLFDGVARMKGKWGPRPDVGVLYRDGSMKAIEVMSKTDKATNLFTRNADKMMSEGISGTVNINNWAVTIDRLLGQ